ncbi:TRAP transporter 4TM/12TM fusion protein [Desulfohalotomaculum tongense]|uniref:TRAP transporter permease n=1 Tax=Desulforadius tongensis TaxID=1216062 RepID=UPI00195C50AE|nr:TRAP transporter permease [Desulforadius tongensis]MBM7855085.1 TRAP transporter 4TM/12TM fusion protein [Desulforadius tongensis]
MSKNYQHELNNGHENLDELQNYRETAAKQVDIDAEILSGNNMEEHEKKAQEIMEKYDAGAASKKQEGLGRWRWVVLALCVVLSLFQLYTAIFGTLVSNQQRGFHVAMALGLIFLLYPGNKKEYVKVSWYNWLPTVCLMGVAGYLYFLDEISLPVTMGIVAVLFLFQLAKYYNKQYHGVPLPDIILAGLGLCAGFYQFFFYEDIISRVGMYNDLDYLMAAIGILLVLEAARRSVGVPIVVMAFLLLVYAYVGPYMPAFFQQRGFSVERIISHSFLSLEGIFGIPISISATFIYLFLMFGVILKETGLEKFFTDLAMSLTGWMTGGTAKVGILTSVFSGTITGSSVANTVGNGAFTIPMMKRSGYKPEFAAAVEAASSTGGQITPPIMGSAAFLMIEFTGLPYSEIIKAAVFPALLFFVGQFIVVHYESKKVGIMGVPRSQLASVTSLLAKQGYLLLPIVVIIVILCIGQSAMRAALMGIATALLMNIIVLIAAYLLGKQGQLEYKLTPAKLLDILAQSARVALPVIAACAAAGVIVGVITLTGLGLRISGGILSLASGKLLLTMFFTMIASIVLGMGLPTTANYVITATMAAPALLAFDNVPVIAAHLFVFYFGIVADITPPVALAAYAGSGLAQSNPMKTAFESVRIAVGAFLVPYMFVLSPELLMVDVTLGSLVLALGTAILGMFCLGTAVVGYIDRSLTITERILLVAAGLGLLYAQLITDIIGLAVFVLIYANQKFRSRNSGIKISR